MPKKNPTQYFVVADGSDAPWDEIDLFDTEQEALEQFNDLLQEGESLEALHLFKVQELHVKVNAVRDTDECGD